MSCSPENKAANNCEHCDCWLLQQGFPSILKHRKAQYLALLNEGLGTAGEPFRAIALHAMATERVQPDLVLDWHCFEADDGKRYWAIASSLRRGSIIYGDCIDSCPGRIVRPVPESLEPPRPPQWRGY